ncbi:hypothetical protein BKG82_26565 [Mycobacteroides chelonae]|uniref:PPE domain-containing protein n=2 Tax=Mycobacteroides chelonae TaxID=1774 RepID=A0A1S1LG15_MYCCH|nr:hypothetical protein BKG82_26565 [Mycobacteroides chelonae]
MPEINAGRFPGAGPATWLASATTWEAFAVMAAQAMAATAAEAMAMGLNWLGLAPSAAEIAIGAHLAWWATMEVAAIANSLACYAVAAAYGAGETGMAPLPEVNLNRLNELIAELTNFLGINSGLIATLNADYARMWTQNGTTMMTYDTAVTAATSPKPTTPPPPLADAAGAGSTLGDALSQAAMDQSMGVGQVATNSMGQATQGATQGAAGPESMMSQMGQFASMPGQLGGQVGQMGGQLTQPVGQLAGSVNSLFGNLGGQSNDASAIAGLGPENAAFAGVPAAATGTGSGGGGGTLGGGLGGAFVPHGSYMGASGGAVKNQTVISGVSNKPTALTTASATGIGGGGGFAPAHGGGGSGSGTTSSSGKRRVLAVDNDDTHREAS